MIRIIRTTALAALHETADRAVELEDKLAVARTDHDDARAELDATRAALARARAALTEATATITALTTARDEAQQHADGLHEVLRQCTRERDAARAEARTARAEVIELRDALAAAGTVVLLHYGRVHSIHSSQAAAEAAAEVARHGAAPGRWVTPGEVAELPPASEVPWRWIRYLPRTTPTPAAPVTEAA
ncbi:hypothetical protein GCM10027160_52210 [Streptomyces calidiresistens]|uniref:Uncharacterized protein n=1 Tax=Streptomyces calidiresistens TaxID=1485586 RepID=A0A7W3T1U1_9ACTN|nr:hypothetical protein [Streptomyces calidiresistens]MBB0229379.1 hypothetical protein [Streptomyces calidiresistens]